MISFVSDTLMDKQSVGDFKLGLLNFLLDQGTLFLIFFGNSLTLAFQCLHNLLKAFQLPQKNLPVGGRGGG
jgi:hypothetical protein